MCNLFSNIMLMCVDKVNYNILYLKIINIFTTIKNQYRYFLFILNCKYQILDKNIRP